MKHPLASQKTRREALAALAASAAAAAVTVSWSSAPRPQVSAHRIRPGATVTLRCGGADAYELRFGDETPRRVAAPAGRLAFQAPITWRGADWTRLIALPLAGDAPCGRAVAIQVFTRMPRFGA